MAAVTAGEHIRRSLHHCPRADAADIDNLRQSSELTKSSKGYEWSHSSPLRSSPDTASPMYPERPIRPMPKRRLRDRMSPEQAEAITFPPQPPTTGPLFNFPYETEQRRAMRSSENEHHACQCGHNHSEIESEEEEDERGQAPLSSPSYHYGRNAPLPGRSAVEPYSKFGSATSSVDGYESFENTNNKKKRKIPNMGGIGAHHSSLSADMANMGISRRHDDAGDAGLTSRYYGTMASTPPSHNASTGVSGAGRGRFGRSSSSRNERRVLGNSTNTANAKANGKRPPDHNHNAGIISTAIANAQATPPHAAGNENVSLLQHEATKNPATKTQFTFTCGSDSASKMAWPGQENGGYPQPPGAYPVSNNGQPPAQHPRAGMSDPAAGALPQHGSTGAPASNRTPQAKSNPQTQLPPPPKPRRSPAKIYAYAARKRRIQQEYANLHNPPDPAWICEFCEYEDIFGAPPLALIRQYEIKDRKERKRLAEKRRLLEKARMKGRKGRKQNKKQANANNAASHQDPPPMEDYDRHPDDGPLDDPEDEFYEDDYDQPPHGGVRRTCGHPGCRHHDHPVPLPPGDSRNAYANGT